MGFSYEGQGHCRTDKFSPFTSINLLGLTLNFDTGLKPKHLHHQYLLTNIFILLSDFKV